ncbi:MAG: hypothetical protein DRP87_15480 [Spirochaetes bacterium]|nr:MAG: hypothetical protein DRP87_15480 [Spirochaetota bacterium]
MPYGDRTGPAGLGPRTGRGAGFCSGYPVPGYMNPYGGVRGIGGGWGRGYRHWYWATGLTGWQRAAMGWPGAYFQVPPYPSYDITPDQELKALRNQVKLMEEGLEKARQRISELEEKEE